MEDPVSDHGASATRLAGSRDESHPLRVTRKGAGLTLKRLAALVDCSLSHLADIERGLYPPSVALADRISEAIGIAAAELFGVPNLCRCGRCGELTYRDFVPGHMFTSAVESSGVKYARDLEAFKTRHDLLDVSDLESETGCSASTIRVVLPSLLVETRSRARSQAYATRLKKGSQPRRLAQGQWIECTCTCGRTIYRYPSRLSTSGRHFYSYECLNGYRFDHGLISPAFVGPHWPPEQRRRVHGRIKLAEVRADGRRRRGAAASEETASVARQIVHQQPNVSEELLLRALARYF